MKIIVTGITGTIGCEVARILLNEGHEVVPIVRSPPEKLLSLHIEFQAIKEYISADITQEIPHHLPEGVDCIIHCAGVVHFRNAGNSNEQMMKNMIAFAHDTDIPFYYVSTAYLCKPDHEPFFNQYEVDKHNAEKILSESSQSHTILRPSIVTGNSQTGEILHFSGYYLIVPAFIEALKKSGKIRFPRIKNTVNIIPIDWVARTIIDAVYASKKGMLYITNSYPPACDELLLETLRFFSLESNIELVDVSFDEYKNMNLSIEEKSLAKACMPFLPYLTTAYEFPSSECKGRLETNYIKTILRYASERMAQ